MASNENLSEFKLSKSWRWVPLAGWTAAGLLLFASWLWPVTRESWDVFDALVFHAMNGTVASSDIWATIWALTGGRRFDALSALMIFAIYLYYIGSGDFARFRHGLAFGLMTAVLLLIIIVLQRHIIAYPRLSPSHVLDGFHSIKDIIPWSAAKEGSDRSFPGDHATVTMILAILWWRGFNWRFGLVGVALAFFFALPRIAAGAHWATDAVIGGGAMALVTFAIIVGTPITWHIYRAALKPADWALSFWVRFADRLSPEGRDNVNPTRQVLRGMCIGAADLVPGVSGGTLALILGIYKRLIGAIASFDRELLGLLRQGQVLAAARHADMLFLGTIGIGVMLSLIIFSRVIPLSMMVTNLPEITFGFFFGLIAASIVGLLSHVHSKGATSAIWIGLGVVLGLLAATLVPVRTPDASWFIFLCGMAAVAAMLVPGVSGSFVLLILGKYTDAIEALGRLDFSFIAPLAAGVVTGALLFSRAISWLLDRFYRQTLLTVIGILGGSLLAVWPFKDRHYETIGAKMQLIKADPYIPAHLDMTVFFTIVAIGAGIFLYRFLDRLAQHTEAEEN
ncbi:undecaprenyl phosphate translocase family protein [Parvibaculum sp.]|uniref:undecaprenyl phosphate translocase family protein n=1 Tax=Parvibaculum sp. TaxID=2024848 RepID=UPI003BAC4EF1